MASFLKNKTHYGPGAFELGGIAHEMMCLAGVDREINQGAISQDVCLIFLKSFLLIFLSSSADQNSRALLMDW